MSWIACRWDAETDEVVVISEISHSKRQHAVYNCISAAEATSYDTPSELLWTAPKLPEDSERERFYALNNNGVIDLYSVKGTFIEGGWVTSEVRDYTTTKVSQFFPLHLPKRLLLPTREYSPIPEEFPPLATTAPRTTSTPVRTESAWHAVVKELKTELKRKRKTKKE